MRVTEKGQITIPVHIREQLGIHPGDEVDVELDHGAARVTRSSGNVSLSQRMRERARGAATTGLSTDEIMALTRGE